jgi:hypothetical protein
MSFIAGPPLWLGQGSHGSFAKQLRRMAAAFWRIIWQTLIPFNPQPEPPEDPPPKRTMCDAQFEQCQAFYAEVETVRNFLEGKARATFSVVTFLVPLLASGVVFLFAHTADHTRGRAVALVFVTISLAFLILAFVSIVRAVSVQVRETLGLNAIIDVEAGHFRPYDRVFHARGLLYCASVNEAMNGHIAQFVKGAHILTALSVIALLGAAVASIPLLPADSSPARTQIIGSVDVASPALVALKSEIEKLGTSISAIANDKTREQRLDTVEGKINQLVVSLKDLEDEVERLRKSGSNAPAAPSPGSAH